MDEIFPVAGDYGQIVSHGRRGDLAILNTRHLARCPERSHLTPPTNRHLVIKRQTAISKVLHKSVEPNAYYRS